MTGFKTIAAFGALVTFGSWLASGVVARRTPPVTSSTDSAASRLVERAAGDVTLGLQRLAARDPTRASAYSAPSRNPFRFQHVPSSGPSAAAPRVASDPMSEAVAQALAPHMQLAGIAEDETPAGVVRSAIVSADGQLWIVRVGELVFDRFRVVAISSTGVELEDKADGRTFGLALR